MAKPERVKKSLLEAEERAFMLSHNFPTLRFWVLDKPGCKPVVTAMEFSRQLYEATGYAIHAEYRDGIRWGR